MKTAIILMFVVVAGGLAAREAAAAMLGDADVPFSAERTVTVNGHAFRGKLFHTPGRERHEQDLIGREIFILDAQAERGWLVVPSLKTYVEFPFPPELAALASPDLTRSAVREETVSGVRTTKYRIDQRVGDTLATGFLWVSPENMLMKFDVRLKRSGHSKPLAVAMELSHVKNGPQDPHLFELPHGLVQMPIAALGPLLGVGR